MKHLLTLSLVIIVCSAVQAADPKPLLVAAAKVIADPSLKEPLDSAWSIQKGTWEVKDGEMTAAEVPTEKHAAVLWNKIGLPSAVIDCDFLLDGATAFIIGCDGMKHVGRVTITRTAARISDDSTEVKGVHPATVLSTAKLDLKPGEWHHAHLEWTGDKMAARIDDVELQGASPALSTVKTRWWFAVSGRKARLKNIKACEGGAQ